MVAKINKTITIATSIATAQLRRLVNHTRHHHNLILFLFVFINNNTVAVSTMEALTAAAAA